MTNFVASNELEKLLSNIDETMATICVPRKCSNQSWGGADIMIINNSPQAIGEYKHFSGQILATSDYKELGNLYDLIRETVAQSITYNHITKYKIWGEITEVLIACEKKNLSLKDKVIEALNKAIMNLKSLENNIP